MDGNLQRSYAEETTISQSMDFYKYLIIALAAFAIAATLGLDVLERKNNLYYFKSMLAAIIGFALILSMLRYTWNFVDEVRAGPDYLVVRAKGVSTIIPIEQIERVRLNYFTTQYVYLSFFAGFLARIEVRLMRPCACGSIIAFHPQTDWRERWTRGAMLKMLRAAED